MKRDRQKGSVGVPDLFAGVEEVTWPMHCRACTHEQIDHRAAYGPCQREDCQCRQWSHRAPR